MFVGREDRRTGISEGAVLCISAQRTSRASGSCRELFFAFVEREYGSYLMI